MNTKILIAGILFLSTLVLSQKCLNHAGKEVNWFLILKTPGTMNPSYHYYDSDTKDAFTFYASSPDQPNHPIYNTFTSLSNSDDAIIAWNDQIPNGGTSSSKAHSKTVIGYKTATNQGIVAVHSMPQYPAITGHTIDPKIADNQAIYGQHFLCFKSGSSTKEILTKASIITPNYYANTNKENFKMITSKLFEFTNLDNGPSRMKIIYKNGKLNGSIFEDGLTTMLSSNLIAETWGRPLSAPWCGSQTNKFQVGNVVKIAFDSGVTWKETQDHSKWAVPIDSSSTFSCFGDMNRMDSQFKRGGAFYCISDAGLNKAMRKIMNSTSICP